MMIRKMEIPEIFTGNFGFGVFDDMSLKLGRLGVHQTSANLLISGRLLTAVLFLMLAWRLQLTK